MSLYWKNNEFRDLDDDLVAAWIINNNPKSTDLVLVPIQPEYNNQTHTISFNGSSWELQEKSEATILEELNYKRNYLSCSPAQGKLALLQYGLLDIVETWISTQPRNVQIEYTNRTEWKRTWSLVIDAAIELGISDIQLDQLFELAQTL